MSKDEIISNVLGGLYKVQDLLDNSDIELCLKEDKSSNKIDKSKEFIDKLFELSKNLKENFYDLYSKYQEDQTKEHGENVAVPNSIHSNGLVLDNSKNNSDGQNDTLQKDMPTVDSINDNVDTKQNDQKEISKLKETEISCSDVSEDQGCKTENIQPLIRLVDLNKLIDPDKHKKGVKFDTSVIVLSSTDDEDKVTNNEKKNSKSKDKSKQITKKQKQESSDSENSDNSIKKLSDVKSDNYRKSRKLKNVKINKSNVNKKINDSKHSKAQVEVILDSSSDSESEKPQRKSTRTSLVRSCKMDDAKLNRKVYVPLPLYQCQKLKEIYNRKKECFDVISFEKLKSLRRSKRTRNSVENETSSDADKSLKKKSKIHNKDDEESQSDSVKVSKKHLRSRKRVIDKNNESEEDSDDEKFTKKTPHAKKETSGENTDSEENTKKNLKPKKHEDKLRGDESSNKKVRFKTDATNKENTDKNSEDEVDISLTQSRKNESSSQNSLKEMPKKQIFKNTKCLSDDKDSNNEKTSEQEKCPTKTVSIQENDAKNGSEEESEEEIIETKSTSEESRTDNLFVEEEQIEIENEKDPLAVDDPLSTENGLEEFSKSNLSENKDSSKDDEDVTIENLDKSKSNKDNSIKILQDINISNKNDANTDNEDESKDSKELEKEKDNSKSDSDEENSKKQDEKKQSQESDITDDESQKNNESEKITTLTSDSDEEFGTFSKKRDQANKDRIKNAKKRSKAVVSDSDKSDDDNKAKEDNEDDDQSDSEKSKSRDESDAESDNEDLKKSTKRKRIKKTIEDSESEEEIETRKHIRKVLDKNSLSETTKQAEAEEKERKARIAEKQKKYNRIFEEKKDATIDKVVLDYDDKTKEPIIEVHKKIVKYLKPHQVSGIQFMYDACFESVERIKNSQGSGCILAHCMGLGKTLQVIALLHTLLVNNKKTKINKAMVVCPINTVLNWKAEFKKWVPSNSGIEVYELATPKKNYERQYTVSCWHEDGGVLIIGYSMFRLLSNPNNKKITKKMRTMFLEGMVDPGPDIVICDEGHLLKNEKTNLSIAMNRIKTARRIVLTGTPLQNNLKEYWCMVQFIKPNLLGTYKEYMNRFVNPITNGQYTDSTRHDTDLMRKRSHVLHKLLDGVVQRRDYAVLEPYLPPKHEYVLFVKLSDVQIKLYKNYIEKYARKNDGSNRTSFLFADFQELQRICTHPRVLKDKSIEKKEKWDDEDEESEGSLKDFIDDGEVSAHSTSSSNSNSSDSSNESDVNKKTKKPRMTRARAAQKKDNNEESSDSEVEEVSKEWWQEFCDGDELDNIKNSGKLALLFEILKECEEIGDKILVFSQSLYTLNCIEYFLEKIDAATQAGDTEKIGYKGSWSLGLDYFRLDGSSSCDNRAYWCESFNNPENVRARLFLISTKAGGLGINLVAANRVIIFDVSWNPSHDVQSIYRVYRFGQTKPTYIYRFVTYGSMEMKIYERQVTKQAISKRVIDEQQIDRHYNQNDLQELYTCDLEPKERPLPMVPKDVLLGEMLQKYENIIYKYHLHQSLLENKQDEGLNEEERKAAWEEFENEKVLRKTTSTTNAFFAQAYGLNSGIQNMSAAAINAALVNIVRRDNPTWSEEQIKGIIPALVRQLQVQIEEQDLSMYQRVVQEIQIMNQARLKESLYQQQMMKLYQQQYLYQKQQQSVLGNLNINPHALQNLYGQANYNAGVNRQFVNGPSTSSNTSRRLGNDVIELND